MDESTSHDTPSDAFDIARRGYDRRQVDAHVSAANERISVLEQRIEDLEHGLTELGLDRPTDLAAELDIVGEEVKRILQEARLAAEQMRSRAADDAARWRADADGESRAVRESAKTVAYEVRRSVWETGSAMIESALTESEELRVAATERALFIQAEAEREASRLVADARRDRDEATRSAREEAELLGVTARQEADAILSAARRQADAAQERARALELRRAELMAELETARATIAGTDAEPPQATERVTSEQPIVEDESDVEPAEDTRSHWPDDDGAVKIVSANRVMTSEPVDADAMVAEVTAMRQTVEPEPSTPVQPLPREQTAVDRPEQPREGDDSPMAGEAAVIPSDRIEDGSTAEPTSEEPTAAEPTPPPQPAEVLAESAGEPEIDAAPAESDDEEEEPSPSESPAPVTADLVAVDDAEDEGEPEEPLLAVDAEAETPREPDPLAGLFAQLKGPSGAESGVKPEPTSDPHDGAHPDRREEAVPPSRSEVATEPSEPDEPDGEGDQAPDMGATAFDVRERLLLPVQNRALRSVKRHLVEAQNRALENLRLIDDWVPDGTIIAGEIGNSLADLAHESMVAGFAGAAEMVGSGTTPQPESVDPGDPTAEFTEALVVAARHSVDRSREAGAGQRETASSLSRVFRSWRTDDAERRVRFASLAAYHAGIAAALEELGAKRLTVIPMGRPCVECPADKGPWDAGGSPPAETVMPPARMECACTVVPAN